MLQPGTCGGSCRRSTPGFPMTVPPRFRASQAEARQRDGGRGAVAAGGSLIDASWFVPLLAADDVLVIVPAVVRRRSTSARPAGFGVLLLAPI
jgi:hypothetical protein